MDGALAYLGTQGFEDETAMHSRLRVLDVGNPSRPRLLPTYDALEMLFDIEAAGTRIYVDDYSGLHILQLNFPHTNFAPVVLR